MRNFIKTLTIILVASFVIPLLWTTNAKNTNAAGSPLWKNTVTKEEYVNFSDAMSEASMNDEILLIRDANLTEGLSITKPININLGGITCILRATI